MLYWKYPCPNWEPWGTHFDGRYNKLKLLTKEVPEVNSGLTIGNINLQKQIINCYHQKS